jgi:hypothetical protein
MNCLRKQLSVRLNTDAALPRVCTNLRLHEQLLTGSRSVWSTLLPVHGQAGGVIRQVLKFLGIFCPLLK